jgi:acylglycerol lipase
MSSIWYTIAEAATPERLLFASALAGVYLALKYRKLSRVKPAGVRSPSLPAGPPSNDDALFGDYLSNSQGLWLHIRQWTVADPKALVFICHGYGEHCGRYHHVAATLNKAGYSVYALDHQGHGASDGDRAFVERFQNLVDDFLLFVRRIQSRFDSNNHPPAFLIGHSMGGAISILTALQSARFGLWAWRGVILSGPLIAADPKVATPFMRFLARTLSSFLPRVELDRLPPGSVSRSPAVSIRYEADPLIYHRGMLARTACELLHACDAVTAGAKSFSFPFMLMQGEADKICSASGARQFFDAAPSPDKALRLYPSLFHEIFLEPERDQVLCDVLEWIRKHLE